MTTPHPSFSRAQRWSLGFKVFLLTTLVFAVVVMANVLGRDFFLRLHLSTRTKIQLSGRTVHFLKSLTNRVTVTIYYDKTDPLYSTISDLLTEYRQVNPRITIQTVDYLRNPGAAQKIKNAYSLTSGSDKNLVIFDAEGAKWKPVDGNALAQYTLEQLPNEPDRKFRRKPLAFLGEMAFTAALLDATNPKPFMAYFLQGHREHDIDSGDEMNGYLNFASYLKQNNIQVQPLSLLGTNRIPADCNLLVIAGPRTPISQPELEQIDQYLSQGGRLLALFNAGSVSRETGLEKVLAKRGVAVGNNIVVDPKQTQYGSDVIVSAFSGKHPVTNPLLGTWLFLIQPRPVGKVARDSQAADAPNVEVIAESSPNAFLAGSPEAKHAFPLMVAVETGALKGVITERGNSRILVVGDSVFLANRQLEQLGNRDFAGFAANWLLDRTQLLEGVGPRPMKEYRLTMTRAQLQSAEWLLLGALPALPIVLGGLIWLRRRR